MDTIKFEWDENQNIINKKKHKISFEEAKTVLTDLEEMCIGDEEVKALAEAVRGK